MIPGYKSIPTRTAAAFFLIGILAGYIIGYFVGFMAGGMTIV